MRSVDVPRLDLGEVQDVVDERQQVALAAVDARQVLALLTGPWITGPAQPER
jgi:hypothetical protein